jgi:cellulose biosynthesis protein BcsQ
MTSVSILAAEMAKYQHYDLQVDYDQQQHSQSYLEANQGLYLGCLKEFLNTKQDIAEIQNPSDLQRKIDIYQLDKVRENLKVFLQTEWLEKCMAALLLDIQA